MEGSQLNTSPTNSSLDPISKITRAKWTGGVTKQWRHESKPQCPPPKHKKGSATEKDTGDLSWQPGAQLLTFSLCTI
jgi:hypothetical protein